MISTIALENLVKITKPYGTPPAYILFKDHEGWSDGFIADFVDLNRDTWLLKARLGKAKGKTRQVIEDKADGVTIAPLLKRITGGNIADTLSFNIETMYVKLSCGDVSAHVNPMYIRYFLDVYKPIGAIQTIQFDLTSEHQAVRVLIGGNLYGLIMPVRL